MPPRMSLEDLLLRHGVVTSEQLEQAKAEQAKWGGEIGRTLVEMGTIPEALLMKAYAHLFGLPLSQPDREVIPKEVIDVVPVQICEQFGVIPVWADVVNKNLRIATSRPNDKTMLAELTKRIGLRLELAAAPTEAIEKAIRIHYYGEERVAPAPRMATPASGVAPATDASGAAPGFSPSDAFMRFTELEGGLEEIRTELQQLGAHHPGFASLMSRVEKLEQQMQAEGDAARALVGALIQRGVLTADEAPAGWRPETGKVALAKLPLTKRPKS